MEVGVLPVHKFKVVCFCTRRSGVFFFSGIWIKEGLFLAGFGVGVVGSG